MTSHFSRGGYMPFEMLLQFPSPSAYAQASRVIRRKGRLYKLERTDRAQREITAPYDEKTILLQGLPQDVTMQDVECFLSGCEYDQTYLSFFSRAADPDRRTATVRFPSKIEDMNGFIKKNKAFVLTTKFRYEFSTREPVLLPSASMIGTLL